MTTREQQNLRVVQPFASEPVRLFPVFQRESENFAERTYNSDHQQDVQLNGKLKIPLICIRNC